jgi:hypothetical protein
MRICIAISVAVHAAIMLWLVLGHGGRPFDPAEAQPIMVELLQPQEAPREAKQEPPKPQESKQKPSPEQPKSDETKTNETKTNETKSNKTNDKKTPDPTLTVQEEDRAATAARLAWMMNLQTDTAVNLMAPPSEGKSNLTAEVIEAFKTQVSKCWSTPDGVPDGVDILVRVAFKPDGKLSVAPELIRAPASLAGPPLVASAKRALQQCQPYAMLPPDKYQDWRVLDLTFTADGPAGLTKASRRTATTP